MSKKSEVSLINAKAAAEILNLKINTLYSLVFKEQIPFYRMSKRIVRFKESEIYEYLSSCKKEVQSGK